MNDLINNPDAARLAFGLRDTGYDVRTAIADIADNSIAANASVINIDVCMRSDGRKFVYIGDNGDGMDAVEIHKAMRYGAPARQNAKSLGKFGLGMKTASSSVCRKLTVVSRKSSQQKLVKLAWDLDHIEMQNVWEMLREEVTSEEREHFEEACGEKGTLVIWSKCDRILSKDYDTPGGVKEQQAIKRLAESLAKNLSLIYHRFLAIEDKREKNIAINVNGIPVTPWNPFFPLRSEQVLSENQQYLEMELPDGTVEKAAIRAWILPHRNDMSKEEEQTHARISNKAQGFYVFREGRLIQDGGWMGVFGMEPHTSLLRIEFDFGHELDEAFKVDVKKSRILFDPGLEEGLKTLLHPVYREAGQRYRRQNRQDNVGNPIISHKDANKNIGATPGTSKASISTADPATQTAVVDNNRGPKIRIRQPVQDHVSPETIHVEAVETITTGELWQSALRSVTDKGYVPGVLLNKHHDFYQKIYKRAAANGYAVEGMDLLLWAFAVAEQNNTNEELEPIFQDIREEISSNLRKLLRNIPDPEPVELIEDGEG